MVAAPEIASAGDGLMTHEPRTMAFGSARAFFLLAALGALACGGTRSSGVDARPAEGFGPAAVTAADDPAAPEDDRSGAAHYDIPPGFLPPPGQCRIWEPGEPPDQQKDRYPIGRCSQLREAIPEGAWLVYRPTDDAKHVRVWLYGSEREVLQQRIYDIETGALIRHVAPASGN